MRGLEQRARGKQDGERMVQIVEAHADPRAEPVSARGLADSRLDIEAGAVEAWLGRQRADGKQKNMVGRCHIPSPMRGVNYRDGERRGLDVGVTPAILP